ncbi:MAG: ATP-binding protein [Bacteroidia bacterium]
MTLKLKAFVCTCLLFCALSNVLADSNYILNETFWGLEDGLSHRDVQCIHEDQQGFMWFGTKYGLNRFDGYSFTWFTAEKHKLQRNEINHILEDKEGRMWLISTGGFKRKNVLTIDIFDPKTYHVASFEETFGKDMPFKPSEVISFNQVPGHELIFLTRDHRFIRYGDGIHVMSLPLGEGLEFGKIARLPSGNIWVNKLVGSNDKRLFLFDPKGTLIHTSFKTPVGYLVGGSDYQSLYMDIPNLVHPISIFQVDNQGDTTYSPAATRFIAKLAPHVLASTIKVTPFGDHFWLQADNGPLLILEQDGSLFKDLGAKHPELRYATVMHADERGALWIGTQFGVFRFTLKPSLFRQYLSKHINGRGDHYSLRNMVVDDHRQLWAVVENQIGLCCIDLASGRDTVVVPSTGYTQALCKTSIGDILFKETGSIMYVDPLSLKIKENEPFLEENGDFPKVWMCREDREGITWIADYKHSKLYMIKGDKKMLFSDWDPEAKGIIIYQMLETNGDSAWLATNSGLFCIDKKEGRTLARYWRKGAGRFALDYDNIHHLHQEKDGSLWMATSGTGLVRWHPVHGVIDRVTRADGLPNNTIYAVYEDEQNNLWLSTDNGIARFNKIHRLVKGYSEKDGLSHYEFNRVSHHQDKEGNIYFGTLSGITVFHPNDLVNDSSLLQSSMVLTSFQYFDGELAQLVDKTTDIRQQGRIVLEPSDRFFRLEFSLLTYDEVDKIQYAYRVEGVDSDWNYQKENTLRLGRLPYGTHTLHIKGQNANGAWSSKELSFQIVVEKPLYLQAWFMILAVLAIALGVFLFFRSRTRALQKQQLVLEETVAKRTATIQHQAEELKSLEKLKSRFFANVSHELRTPLTLMLGPIDSLLKRNGKNETDRKLLTFAQRNGRQLQKLINEILDLAKLESNKLELVEEPVRFYPYLLEQMTQFQSFADSDSLEFKLKYDAPESLALLLDTGKFEKILHNFLSNAMKFTPQGGLVTLVIEEEEQALLLKVIDNGKGIHPDDVDHVFDRFYQSKQPDAKTEGGTGIGLSLCRELAELLGGEVWAESVLGKGSTFYFRFPIKKPQEALPLDKIAELLPARSPGDSQPAEADLIAEDKAFASKNARILVVEDNADLREYLAYLLSEYHVQVAENGQVAWSILTQKVNGDQFQPDMIISDLMMPVMDGIQLLGKLKGDDRFRHIPTIMLTAKVNAMTRLEALRIGVDDYLTKPFQEDELKARIGSMLRNYQERMQFFAGLTQTSDKERAVSVVSEEPVISNVDAEWLIAVEALYTEHVNDARLTVDFAAEHVHLSARQFRRRLKQLTGLSPKQYLQEMRLQQARDLLVQGRFATIKEVCHSIGLNDVRYFSDVYKKRFGINPSEARV